MFVKHNPAIRILLPFATGIIIQWYMHPSIGYSITIFAFTLLILILLQTSGSFYKYKYAAISGIILNLAMIACGMLITWIADIRHQKTWLGNNYTDGQIVAVMLQEPLVEKERSYKAEASLKYLINENTKHTIRGKVILYLKKDSASSLLKAGSIILFKKYLQEIKNASNPGGFDYKRYALFNGITHQIYLTQQDYIKLPGNFLPFYKQILFNARAYVLTSIEEYIIGKKEQGLAEAMLIGYKDNLDKSLLQSYTNTGVVHVIAVSGMHLALLYWIIDLILKPLYRRKSTRWLHAALVLLILWGFCFITGGAASIVRAAVMFTFITIGKQINRNSSIYNILAASAFFQLCYNPYWLWDIGFQLSYIAVLSIVIFYTPIYQLLFIKNKILDWVWRLAAVSMAAQILTIPLCIYYFHQFPVYFLLSNLVVVPVSTVVLIGTLILVLTSPIKIIAAFLGFLLEKLIWWLNTFISLMEDLPFAVWTGMQISLIQSFLIILIIAGLSFWLIEKYKQGLWIAMTGILFFFAIRSYSFYKAERQHQIIVYNTNRYTAVDFINGRQYFFVGSEMLYNDLQLNNFVLKPSHTLYRVNNAESLNGLYKNGNAIVFNNKKIILLNSAIKSSEKQNISADIVILSGNPRLYMIQVQKRIDAKQIVIDASVPAWKASYWIKDCDSLKIPCHNVATDGAFVMSLH